MTELHSAVDGDGLQLSGWFTTWDEDSAAEAFAADAFDESLPRFLNSNPVVLHAHDKNSPPIGYVTSAHIDKRKGVYGTVVLPKPELGTKAMEVYSSVKNNLIRGFSAGGFWERYQDALGRTKLRCKRLLEVSLCGLPTNEYALADGGITAVQGVKAIGDTWIPAGEYDRRCREDQEWIALTRAGLQLRRLDGVLTTVERLRR